ncbi:MULTISPECIES: hypothetical protein [Silvimonas]|uniref:hypothetical protein n=1 Tax=Silvimonas TaxID=300264 RepID=UPI0024B36DA7|nr:MULTISPECIES: hypothetical protein [Silvimonas]MDR3426303.1 hypothetical protein [Silvimonas sp.]
MTSFSRFVVAITTFATAAFASADGGALTLRFASPLWNGSSIPAGQQCSKLGGAGATPGLNVFDVPANASALLVEFSEHGGANDGGGMGRLIYTVPKGATSAQIPAIAAQGPVPAGVKSLGARDGSIYAPPCSKGGRYVVTVKALANAADPNPVAEGRLDMGRLQ